MIKTQTTLKHFVTTEYLEIDEVFSLIQEAIELKNTPQDEYPCYHNEFVSNLFFENSTRTHLSFEVAQKKLGMQVIQFDPSTSSMNKGETLLDTVITLEALGIDTLVIRSSEEHYYDQLLGHPEVHASIINGGDGSGQHPSQSLLDLMTIYEEFGYFQGLEVAIVGDLRHSRVARSNAQMLSRLGAKVYFSGPYDWYDRSFDGLGQYMPIDYLVDRVDVMMMLRVQTERHATKTFSHYAEYHLAHGLTEERAGRMKSTAIIMHPAPVNRGVEIADSLVTSAQSRIVQQMQNGLYARMAVLQAVIAGKEAQ